MEQALNAEISIEKNESKHISLKLQSDFFEFNIELQNNCLDALKKIENTPWEDGSIQLGKSAGREVFWACDEELVSILIGKDDEVWDIGFFLPIEIINNIISEIESS